MYLAPIGRDISHDYDSSLYYSAVLPRPQPHLFNSHMTTFRSYQVSFFAVLLGVRLRGAIRLHGDRSIIIAER